MCMAIILNCNEWYKSRTSLEPDNIVLNTNWIIFQISWKKNVINLLIPRLTCTLQYTYLSSFWSLDLERGRWHCNKILWAFQLSAATSVPSPDCPLPTSNYPLSLTSEYKEGQELHLYIQMLWNKTRWAALWSKPVCADHCCIQPKICNIELPIGG